MSTTTLNIPILSSTAGVDSDGVIFGSVAQSPMDFLASKRVDATTVKVFARDENSGNFTFTELSSPGSDSTANDTPIFGSLSTMSALDTAFISDTDTPVSIHVQIGTSGVYTGTGIKLYDSVDGVIAGRQLTGVVDPTNGFRAAPGWYEITWTPPVTPGVAFSPVPGDIPSRKYIMIALDGFTGVTTAPVLSRVVVSLATDGQKYTDVTSIANGPLNVSFSLPDYFPAVGEESIFHFTDPAYGLENYVFQARTPGIETVVWEYLRNDNTWQPVPNLVDLSDNSTITPSTSPEDFTTRWTIPSDWTPMTYSIPMSDLTTHTATAYWMRVRVTAVSSSGFITPAIHRFRARKFGAANTTGIVTPTAKTFTYLNIPSIGGLSGNDTVAQITNMNTGRASAFTIPASPTLPLNYDITDISFSANDKYSYQWVSGAGNITDIQTVIEYN